MSGDETVVASILGILRMDDSPWERTVDRAKAKARELGTVNPTITVKVDADAAEAKLSLLQRAKSALSRGRAEIKVDADTTAARAQLGQLDSSVGRSGGILARYRAAWSASSSESDKAMRATVALANAHRSLQNSAESVAAAEQRVAVAQERIHATGAGAVEDYRRLESAQRSLNSALRGNESALDRVRLAEKRFRDEAGSLATSAGGASPSVMLLAIAAAAVLIGPAMGAAAAGTAGFVGIAGTAFAVYKGFQQEIKDGTPIGLQLQGVLSGIGGELSHLEQIAANSASGGVLGMLDQIHAAIPEIEPEIAGLAAHLGRALNIATPGVISIIKQLGPILNDAGVDTEHLAREFTNFAGSAQFRQFLAYARTELPVVIHDLADVAKTAVDLGVALQPVGDTFLARMDSIAKGVDKLTGPLTTLTRMENSQGLGGKSLKLIDNIASPLGRAVDLLGMFGHKTKQSAQSQAELAQAALEESVAQNQANVALSTGYDKAVAFATANDTATQAIQREKDASAAATRQMYLESDAGGLLKQQLDALSGKQLDAADAQNQFDQSLLSGAQTIASAKQSHDKLATSLGLTKNGYTGMAQAQIQNRASLLNEVHAAEASAEAYGSMDKSGAKTRQRMVDLRAEIIANAKANGQNADEVTRFIDSVLKIPAQVPPTKADVDTAAAQRKLAVLNDTLGHMVGPTLTVRARVDGALASIRSVVEYAAGQTAVIHVVTSSSTGATSGGRQVLEGPPFADGGRVGGSGGPRSDNQLILASPGEEIIQNGPAQKYAALIHAIRADAVPGYADGGIVSLRPKASGSASSKSKAEQVIVPITVTAGGGQAYGIASYIRGEIPSAAQATRLLSAAVNDAFQLKGIQAKLAAAKAGLANLQTARTDLRGTATDALQGVDPSQYGDAGDLTSVYQNKTATAGQFTAEVRKLGREHLTGSLLAQLAGKGPSAGLDALAAAGPGQIAQLNKAYAGYIASTSTAGSVAANTVYSPGIAADQRAVATYTAQSARTEQAMIRAVATLGQLVNRPVKVMIGNKEVAHAVIDSSEFQGVFDDLARTISYGRKR